MNQDQNFSMSKDEKLNGNNYPLWSFKMKQSFIKEKIWYVVRENLAGLIFDPNDPLDPTPAEIRAAQNKVLYMLTKAIEDKMLARYVRIDDPAVLWAELCRACAGNTTTRRAVLKRKLFSLRFPESDSMSTNFNTVNEILNDLAAVDVNFTDEELQGVIIDALPPSWETFGAVLAGREHSPTFSQIENIVREEESRRAAQSFHGE